MESTITYMEDRFYSPWEFKSSTQFKAMEPASNTGNAPLCDQRFWRDMRLLSGQGAFDGTVLVYKQNMVFYDHIRSPVSLFAFRVCTSWSENNDSLTALWYILRRPLWFFSGQITKGRPKIDRVIGAASQITLRWTNSSICTSPSTIPLITRQDLVDVFV